MRAASASASSAPIALTMGEPGGVGPEITIKAHHALKRGDRTFFVIADPAVFRDDKEHISIIGDPQEAPAVFSTRLPVLDLEAPVRSAPGVAERRNARAVIASIERAVSLAIAGAAAAVVTNPIQKASLIEDGFAFSGHTEFLHALTAKAAMPAGRRRGAVMMLAAPGLRTVPVTIHRSVREAASMLTQTLIVDTARIVVEALIHDFAIARPRLAISGLNPHAGEGGAIGDEDCKIIAPAVKTLRSEAIDVVGPAPADTMFHEEARARYDAALCMLHDQALIPVKTLAFHDAVNITLGLPIIRTSPDHGTALDIAGSGAARADSLIAAIRLASELAAARRRAAA